MPSPSISVVLATYNGAAYLQEQLDSLAAQEVLPFELVVGDDGSSDGTLAILERFAASAPFPVRVERNARSLGFADNFLSAASRTTGDWIAFCDQDDVWLPRKIGTLGEAIGRHPGLAMVAHQADITDATLRPLGRRPGWLAWTGTRLVPPGRLDPFAGVGGIALCVRADLLRDIDWRERSSDRRIWRLLGSKASERVPHDRWAVMLGGAMGDVLLLDEALVLYRRHGAAETGFHTRDGARGPGAQLDAAARFDLADAAADAAAAFEKAAARLDGDRAQRLRVAARRYRRVARVQRARGNAAPGRSRLRRASGLIAAIGTGAYPGRDGAGFRGFVRDLVGLFLP